MSWTNLDDRWDISSKLIRAAESLKSDAPHAMWARGITHCNREHTDGRIHGAVLRSKTYHRKPQRVIDSLVEVGALHIVGDDEYEFHDFLEWNASRAVVEKKRKAKQEAGKIGGARSGQVRGATGLLRPDRSKDEAGASQNGSSCLGSGSPKTNPSPSPSPSPSPRSSLTGGAEDLTGSGAQGPARQQQQQLSSEWLLSELRRHPALESVANSEFAVAILGRLMSRPKPLDLVAQAIADAGADSAGQGLNQEVLARKVRAYVDNARRRDVTPASDAKPEAPEPTMLRSPTPAEVAHAQAQIDKRRAWLLSLSGDVQAPTPAQTTQNRAGDPAAREQSTIPTATGNADPELASA